jgi:hypothetical protein
MNKQEFKENMLLLRKQVEMLTHDLGMRVEFSITNTMFLPKHIECSYEIRLEYKGHHTADMFNSTMSFGTDDINKVAVALISSFFADYVGALSLRVNK